MKDLLKVNIKTSCKKNKPNLETEVKWSITFISLYMIYMQINTEQRS